MKKKFNENSDEENEFDVDEPEEIQNNATDDEWTPDKDTSGGRRTSTRLRSIPKSRAPIIDASSSDEDNSDESGKRKGKTKGRGRPPVYKKQKVSSSTTSTPNKSQSDNGKSANSDCEPSSTTTSASANNSDNTSITSPNSVKISKEYTSGAFVVLKTDAANLEQDPPLWKIDGKALLQKYVPFQDEGKTLYKNTSVYSGWTINNKDNYYPITVVFKQQTRKEHIVEFPRDQLKFGTNSPEIITSTTSDQREQKPDIHSDSSSESVIIVEKPVIKVKSFAIVPAEETKTPATPIVIDKPAAPEQPQYNKMNANYIPGSFLVLRSDAANVDPPLWKIDGKALLQKYNPFCQNGKTLYTNTAEYSGWSLNNKNNYFPVATIFQHQNKKDHIVALDRIKWDEPDL